ncbi:MAG: MBL fold metallo-hydrolase [Gemmiger sp.]
MLITAAGHAVVVDPAAEAETYLAQLKENNATLTDIFLTHGHYDHVGSVTP